MDKQKTKRVKRSKEETLLEKRKEAFEAFCESQDKLIATNLPEDVDRWLHRFQHQDYKKRVTKKELIIRGLKLLYLSVGEPGEAQVDLARKE